ncbi:hypothetical protein B484DRAFT_428923 [Ochromonadaceae sp. CCMP2298]|nr:hypothetical protein B484DRAFT_428923 [Ochromonadaceae sp. CCMP2298]
MMSVLGNAAYLFIDMNGGGDAYSQKYDYELEPKHRMGWRLLAAVCRGSLGIKGVEELRNKIAVGKGPDVAVALRGKNFNAIADLLDSMHCKLDYPLQAEEFLLALSRDLRGTTCDSHTGAAVGGLNSNERVAIYVHVDEHQFMYGKGLGKGVTKEEKLTDHKNFLYDLCTLRGDGSTTLCNDNNIFLLPIFTGTASVVLAGLAAPTRFSKKRHLQLLPLKAKDSQEVFLNQVKVLNDANTEEQVSIDSSWTSEGSWKTPPLHYILQELGCIPRLIKERLPEDTFTMGIFSQQYKHELLQQAFNSTFTGYGSVSALAAALVREEMTRVVVSGAHLDYHTTILDGKTVADYEFDGSILLTEEGMGSVSLPAIDYRKSVANIRDLSSIAAFASLDFKLKDWSGLWEKMGLNRFRNTLFVHRRLLKKDSITLEQLYPGDKFDFDSTAWTDMIEGICDGECQSLKLDKSHPTFDLIHLIRDKDVLWRFLEQYKAPSSPTRESRPLSYKDIGISCDKFVSVIKKMADTVRDQGIRLRVASVHIDLREKKNEELTQFYSKLWKDLGKKNQFEDLLIVTTIAGSAKSIPRLFPCLAHRFVLLEEEKEKEEEEAKQRRAS